MFRVVKDLEVQMKEAARNLQFEKAAQFRDEIFELRRFARLGGSNPLTGGVQRRQGSLDP